MEDKYPNISPYVYCMNNSIKLIDPSGDSCAVLLAGNAVKGFGHMAILVQNEENEWLLWSKNGDDDGAYKSSSGETRGTADDQPLRDSKTKKPITFKTVQEFLDSKYNTEKHDGVGEYYYTEAYVLPTTSSQDKKIAEGMRKKMDEKYNFFFNNCSQAVVYSLGIANVKLSLTYGGDPMNSFSQSSISVGKGTIPIAVYQKIKQINPGNKTYYAPKK